MALGGILALRCCSWSGWRHRRGRGRPAARAGDLGRLAGALVARRVAKRVGTARILLLGVLVAGLAGLLIPLTAAGPRAAFFVAGSGVVFAAITSNNIVLISFRQTYTPAEILGRVIASQRFLVFGTAPLGAAGRRARHRAGNPACAVGIVAAFALSGTLLLTPAFLAAAICPRRLPN